MITCRSVILVSLLIPMTMSRQACLVKRCVCGLDSRVGCSTICVILGSPFNVSSCKKLIHKLLLVDNDMIVPQPSVCEKEKSVKVFVLFDQT